MGAVYGIVLLATYAASTLLLARTLAPRGVVDFILLAYVVGSAEILISGYLLSALGAFGSQPAWAAAGALWLGAAPVVSRRLRPRSLGSSPLWALPSWGSISAGLATLSTADRLLFAVPAAVVLGLGATNLSSVLLVAPNTVDGLTYHLARVGYYLQHGHLGWFDANYPPQVIQGKGSAVMKAWAFLAANRFEGAMVLVQYVAYWVTLAAIYGLCRHLGISRRHALLAACIFGLLPIALTQAAAPMNDLVGASYIGCAGCFLASYRSGGSQRDLVASGLAATMAAGVKATGLIAMPALAVVAWWAVRGPRARRDALVLAAAMMLGVVLFVLPAGYAENYARFGDPVAPAPGIAQHSLVHKPLPHIASHGPKNIARLGLEFLSLDGLPPVEPVNRLQRVVRLPALAGRALGLEEPGLVRAPPFAAYRDPRAREEHSYWGVLGIGLLWIVPWVAVRGTLHGAGPRVLAAAAVVYFLTVAFAGEYDPWRGRLFLAMGVFALPAIAAVLEERQASRAWRGFTLAVVGAGCLSALSAVVFREHGTLISASYGDKSVRSIHLEDRAGQLTGDIPRYAEPVRRFEVAVPAEAVVAIYGDYMFEYVFFGPRLTRRLVPLGDGRGPMRPIPDGVEFLVFSSKSLEPTAADEHLGEDWYLRRLRPAAISAAARQDLDSAHRSE